MRDPLLRLAGEAAASAKVAHDRHRDESLTLGPDGAAVLGALSDAAGCLETLAGQLERLAAEATPST
jgi:hypothetical protein